jgi:hypothetical protein
MNPRPPGWLGRLLLLIGMALATTLAAAADDPANPYSVIVERNVFHLNPPPPPPEAEKPKVDLPVIKITGFVNIGNQSKALFVSQPKDKKDEPTYYSLAEGEKSGTLELVKIHPGEEGVDIINDGVPATLTVKDNSLVPSTDASPAEEKGGSPEPKRGNGIPGRSMFSPGRYSSPGVPGVPGGGGFQFPSRARRNLP